MERIGSKKIRKGDVVLVMAGNSKGQKGEVLAVAGEKVVVKGINICKKHVKKSKETPEGGTIEMERPIHVSNVSACDSEGNAVKLKFRFGDNGEKILCYKKDDQNVVWRVVKPTKIKVS
jgi:large subunit ribosomal protein L24